MKFDFQLISQISENNLRPTIPSVCPPNLIEIIQKSWDKIQDKRPSIEELIQNLLFIQDIYLKNQEEWNVISSI